MPYFVVGKEARAFSVSIESKRGSRFVILTRFLDANRVHFAGKRSGVEKLCAAADGGAVGDQRGDAISTVAG
jgi:hypothetical protein